MGAVSAAGYSAMLMVQHQNGLATPVRRGVAGLLRRWSARAREYFRRACRGFLLFPSAVRRLN